MQTRQRQEQRTIEAAASALAAAAVASATLVVTTAVADEATVASAADVPGKAQIVAPPLGATLPGEGFWLVTMTIEIANFKACRR